MINNIKRITTDHYPLIRSWYEARNKPCPSVETLSNTGYMADGRVAGWLYLTNSNVAMVDGIISDPNTVPSLRRESLQKLSGFLVDMALMLGYTNIFGMTKHPSLDQMGKKLGFRSQDFKVWAISERD